MPSKIATSLLCLALAPQWLAPTVPLTLKIVDDPGKQAEKRQYLASAPAKGSARPPNVVLILADDLGKTDISRYGNPLVQTPHIDSIGTDGMTFDEGYVTAPVCSPSRAGLMTGRYQQRFGFEILTHDRYAHNWLEWFVFKYFVARDHFQVSDEPLSPDPDDILRQGLPPSEITMAEMLKRQGYQTAIMGKWHLGSGAETIPIHRGFDYHYGFYDGYSFYANPRDPDIVNYRHDDFTERFIWENARQGNCALRRNHAVIDDDKYLTTRIAEESVGWMKANRDKPFFLYVPFSAPHTPFQATRAYYNRFAHIQDPNKRTYYAMIAALDDAVGDILKGVRDLGLEQDTMVVFLSDNGGATYTGATDNAPLRGGKLTNFEGGLNVPFMMRFPGRMPAGRRFSTPVSSLDVFTTVAKAVGADLPPMRKYDGVDLLPYLRGENPQPPHPELYWRAMYTRAVRKGPYKLVRDDKSGHVALFDVVADKSEQHNLATERPEVLQQLDADFAAWARDMQNPLWPRVADYRHLDKDGVWYFPL